jgi:hypothetical protein
VINHGGYSLSHAVDDVILPDGSMKKIENATKQYLPNSFKVINKNYDMSK